MLGFLGNITDLGVLAAEHALGAGRERRGLAISVICPSLIVHGFARSLFGLRIPNVHQFIQLLLSLPHLFQTQRPLTLTLHLF